MISVSQALSLIEENFPPLQVVEKELIAAVNRVISEDILASIDMPPFSQSAMDGYALKWNKSGLYRVIGEQKAGDSAHIQLGEGEAIRIFTGAQVPQTADTVVIQEHTERKGEKLRITKSPSKGANIRLKGEQFKRDCVLMKKGTLLHESHIGLLATLGHQKVSVYRSPDIAIIITGNELQIPGTQLAPGKVYESNSFMLRAALKRHGFENVSLHTVKDDATATHKVIQKALEEHDILLISGGISVGDYDFVRESLYANKVTEIFYKINQKPGKPLWFGSKNDKKVFALPGNPASSLICFYVYVLPFLKKLMGLQNSALGQKSAQLSTAYKNTRGKTLFLKAMVKNAEAVILDGQSSAMLSTFALSNALIIIPKEKTIVQKGEPVCYIDLNYE